MALALLNSIPLSDDSEDEDMYVPIPFRFHDLAARDETSSLEEEIKQYNKKDYNPKDVELSLDQEDNYGFTPLHIAMMRGNMDTLKVCVQNGANLSKTVEEISYSVFLLYLESSKAVFGDRLVEALKLVLLPKDVMSAKDRLGRSLAHLACAFNMPSILVFLQQTYPDCTNLLDHEGNSILHTACIFNQADLISTILDVFPSSVSILNRDQQSALHVALLHDSVECYQVLIRGQFPELDIHAADALGNVPIEMWKKRMNEKRERNTSGFPHEEQKTLVLTPDVYSDHQTAPFPPSRAETYLPPEQIQRLGVLVGEEFGGSLRSKVLEGRAVYESECDLVEVTDMLRVHGFNYVMKLMKACGKETTVGYSNVDIDTAVSKASLTQARKAARCLCDAVDHLVKEERSIRNVFCCVRPPGHHIGTDGAINNANNANVSQGFCLLNNVAIGAAYARSKYPYFARVAIVDLDVHHGNGTEDCVQHVHPIQHVTVATMDNCEMKYTSYQYKPWRNEQDGENVAFFSVHGYGKLANNTDYFYPGSGRSESHVEYIPSSVTGLLCEKPTIVDVPISKEQAKQSFYWRESLRKDVFPRLLDFHPDLIFISAGFDGHRLDRLNNGFGGLSESDFAYATAEIVKIANSCCDGRVISVLEGGYNVLGGCCSPLALSTQSHVIELSRHFYDLASPEQWQLSSDRERKECGVELQEADVADVADVAESGMNKDLDVISDEEEEGFDFDAISEEDGLNLSGMDVNTNTKETLSEMNMNANTKETPSGMDVNTNNETPSGETKLDDSIDDDNDSQDIPNYELPDIEEGELEKIVDPLANEEVTGRKRARPRIDYAALERQLQKEEEEMRKKQMKQ